jgi:preprotein translocase subunit SecA
MTAFAQLTDVIQFFRPRGAHVGLIARNIIVRTREINQDQREATDTELRERVKQLRAKVQTRVPTDSPDILIPGFALINEAARRAAGIQYYDVQLMAGLALARNSIAEMATGEGKTYVGALAAFIHSLHGRGVHFMTTNAYLAERDYEIISPIFRCLGVSIGLLRNESNPQQKKEAYESDVTYGPGYEYGFDYLRDQAMLLQQPKTGLGESYRNLRKGQAPSTVFTVQRGQAFAIVDEIDSVLIDEATTPLILAGNSTDANPHPKIYLMSLKIAKSLSGDKDYVFDPASRNLRLTEQGAAKAYAEFDRVSGMELRRPWPDYIEQGLQAHRLMKRDIDYVVDDGKVKIVDERTGRIFADRSWRNGLHQMVEAKENVTITPEKDPLAKISRQQYFRMYDGLCGMTGTATGCEREFQRFYRLSVSVIPTRKPNRRKVFPTRYFDSADAKWNAIASEVERMHATGQPVLVGTRSIKASELISLRLDRKGISHQLLNGRQDAEEAAIVARAGQVGVVTIATNMAGRGTDIRLGSGAEDLGGLHVIVAEPHDSRRIDRQLMGRAARQGDSGSCQMFVSVDDDLIRLHAPWLAQYIRKTASENGRATNDLDREIAGVQLKVERSSYAKRRGLFAHDSWFENVMEKLAKSE